MREVKFRVWSIRLKRMSVSALTLAELMETAIETNTILMEDKSQLIWMQFTGLRDKNGKEIYEGDVLDLGYKDESVFIVDWEKDRWKLFRNGVGISDLGSLSSDVVEVIGNVYEKSIY